MLKLLKVKDLTILLITYFYRVYFLNIIAYYITSITSYNLFIAAIVTLNVQ